MTEPTMCWSRAAMQIIKPKSLTLPYPEIGLTLFPLPMAYAHTPTGQTVVM